MNTYEPQNKTVVNNPEDLYQDYQQFRRDKTRFNIAVVISCSALILACVFISANTEEPEVSTPIEEHVVEASVMIDEETDISPIVEDSVEVSDTDVAVTDISTLYENEIKYIAKTVYGEARGNTKTEQAAVVWTILNRVDSDLRHMPNDIIGVVTQAHQYVGYNPNHPVTDDIVELVEDVLTRWTMEKNGATDVGRVLPKDYLWFHGDGKHNYFTNEWRSGNKWDWTLKSPYEM